MNEPKPLEPWQWPEPHWRKLVNQVRAGRSYRPQRWKNGARCAFALSFDSDHETNELRDGGKTHGVPATFYVPAVAALIYPDEQRRVIDEGHEIGIHSWIHELNSVLPYEAEKDLMMRAADLPVPARDRTWVEPPLIIRAAGGSVHPEYAAVKLAVGFPP